WKLSRQVSRCSALERGGCTLVFADNYGIGQAIIESFIQNGVKVISIRPGVAFRQETPDSYFLHPGDETGYRQLFECLNSFNQLPDRVIHCWGVEEGDGIRTAEDEFSHYKDLFFYSIVNSVKASLQFKNYLKEITVLTSGLQNIFEQNHFSSPTKSLSVALLKVISQEYPSITTGHIDISLADVSDASFSSKLFEEIINPQAGKIVSYRNSCRWVPVYDKLQVGEEPSPQVFRHQGIYLITGGLGRFGYVLSQYLTKNYNAKLVLLGREKLPERSKWSHYLMDGNSNKSVKEKIERIRSIESDGGQVLYFDCDISDKERFFEVLEHAEDLFGSINGVFHAAVVANGRSINTLDQLTRADFESQHLPKINGLIALYEKLKDRELDFCFIASSLSSILGGLAFGAYATANSFMDYFLQIHKKTNQLKNWVCVNLDGINFDDTSNDFIHYQELPGVISHALALKDLPQLVISTKDIQTRLNDWISKNSLHNLDEIKSLAMDSQDFVNEKFTAVEERLMSIWVKFFGKSDFGIDDDFFEIGGDSLKALNLNTRITKNLRVNLSLSEFFKNPTIRSLAAFISSSKEETVSAFQNIRIQKAPIEEGYDLSSAQKRVYFLNQLNKSLLSYNEPQVVKLEGSLDKDKLANVFERLIDRHESLRTSFQLENGHPVQKIHKNVSLDIHQMKSNADEAPVLLKSFIRPFDLSIAPLLRVGLIELSDNVNLLVVDMHHIITDGISQGVLIKDFKAIYANEDLPELNLQYKDYSEWQHQPEQVKQLVNQRAFWLQEFSEECVMLNLPTDYPRPQVNTYEGNSISFLFNKNET
ncbi:MAG: hypothetical protein C0490_12675, partial [Marivirga sp.]|nr:hypothetical protein [Marivirga sp.]